MNTGIESGIISSYEDLQECAPEMLGFSNATLAVNTPKFKAGDKVDSIWFEWEESQVRICTNDGTELDKFKVKLIII